ncbi:MAG: substrate-binding domain-containing protein [Microbacteriaceae bacterium]
MTQQPSTRRRRIAAGIAAIPAAVLAVTACAGTGSPSASGSRDPADVHVAFIYQTTDSNFAQEMALGATAAGEDTGVDLDAAAPPQAIGAPQVQLFQAAERTSTDGIALATLFPDLFVRPFTDAADLGIPTIAVDAGPAEGAPVDLYIGNDNVELGEALATALLPSIPEDATGEILIGTDTPGLPVLTDRNTGFKDVIQDERPGITFVEFDSKQSPTDNYSAWSSAVSAHPDAIAYVGPGSQDAASLAQIEQKTGTKLLVGAADLDPIALQGVADGYVTALASPEHWLKGYIAISLLADHAINGTELPTGWWNPGYLVVDADNVAEITERQSSAENRTAWFAKEAQQELANPDAYLSAMPDAG